MSNNYNFQRSEMETPLQSSHYNPSRETLGRYSEYSLHSSYKIRGTDAGRKFFLLKGSNSYRLLLVFSVICITCIYTQLICIHFFFSKTVSFLFVYYLISFSFQLSSMHNTNTLCHVNCCCFVHNWCWCIL